VQLVLPWLRQDSAVGWRDPDQLSENANAVCTALAVVRLALLKAQPAAGNAAAGGVASVSGAIYAAGGESDAPGALLKERLQPPLQALSAGVAEALRRLQAANRIEQDDVASTAASLAAAAAADEGGSSVLQQQQQQRVRIPGDAQGAGQAVDAWLAVSRVQDVLDRVLELL
jgi:hypothetical protein